MSEEKLTSSEAIFGFCAWLTCRDEKTIMSATDNAGEVAELISRFIAVNELPEPRENYADYLTHPKD